MESLQALVDLVEANADMPPLEDMLATLEAQVAQLTFILDQTLQLMCAQLMALDKWTLDGGEAALVQRVDQLGTRIAIMVQLIEKLKQ